MTVRDAKGRFAYQPEPDFGPYEIEIGSEQLAAGPAWGWRECNVVDLRRPNGGSEEGFAYVFSGTYAECEAWIEAHSIST